MRTDRFKMPVLGLFAAAVFAVAVPATAQDTVAVEAPPAAELSPARDTVILEPGARTAAPARPRAGARQVGPVLRLTGDYTVEADEVVDGSVVVSRGDLHVHGRVRGDVTVARGDLVLYEGAHVDGNAYVRGGALRNQGAVVLGEMSATSAAPREPRARNGATAAVRVNRGWWNTFGRSLAGIFQTVALGLVLAGLGAALVFFALPTLRDVSGTVRREPWRAGGLGVAAAVLALPVFILGLVTLLVTIIGIPLVLLYVPLFWAAIVAASAVGVVGVAHAIGEHTAERRPSYDPRYHNAYAYTFIGIGLLLAPLLMQHLIGMTGILGFVSGLVGVLAFLVLWIATAVGLGASLLVANRRWAERRRRKWAAQHGPPPEREPATEGIHV